MHHKPAICKLTTVVLASLVLVALSGCGGGGGGGLSGLNLSGGSIPSGGGGGTITGNLALPTGQPLTSATTTATNLATNQSVPVTSSIDGSGNFTVTGVPESTNLAVSFVSGSTTLQTIVSYSQVTSSTPVNIGQVNATTTVMATAIQTEISDNIDTPVNIVSTQLANVAANQASTGETESQQEGDITSGNSRKSSANKLIIKTADSDVRDSLQKPTTSTGGEALDGVLAYVVASGGALPSLTSTERANLIAAEIAGTTYTDTQIVTALGAAGVNTNTTTVDADDKSQRQTLHSINPIKGIPPVEAMAIAGCPTTAAGFGLSTTQQAPFVDSLLGN